MRCSLHTSPCPRWNLLQSLEFTTAFTLFNLWLLPYDFLLLKLLCGRDYLFFYLGVNEQILPDRDIPSATEIAFPHLFPLLSFCPV